MSLLSASAVLAELQEAIEVGREEGFDVPEMAAERLALRFLELESEELAAAIMEIAAFAGFLKEHKNSPTAARRILDEVEVILDTRSIELHRIAAEAAGQSRSRGARFLGVA